MEIVERTGVERGTGESVGLPNGLGFDSDEF